MGASEEELVALVKSYMDAWNAHDLEAVMSFFADDAILKVGPPPAPPGSEFAAGKQQIRSTIRAQLPGFHVEAWDYRVSGNTVMWAFEYSADAFRDIGVDSLEGTAEVVFEGGKIKHSTVTFGPQTVQKLGENLTKPP